MSRNFPAFSMQLSGKRALVTGSTGGIGLAIARALAAEGADVAVNGFGAAEDIRRIVAELAAMQGQRVRHFAADLAKSRRITLAE